MGVDTRGVDLSACSRLLYVDCVLGRVDCSDRPDLLLHMMNFVARTDVRLLLRVAICVDRQPAAPLEAAPAGYQSGNSRLFIIEIIVWEIPQSEILPPIRFGFPPVVVQNIGQ